MPHGRHILVVEDDAGIRTALLECLELEGYSARAVASGLEALEQIEREGLPALILLDVVMPGMTGQELLDILREHPSTAQVPVVVMTAATPVLTAPLPGADGFLSKPFDLRELLAAASRWCDGPPAAALAQP